MSTTKITFSELGQMAGTTNRAAEAANTFSFLQPIKDNISIGWYTSKIVKVEPNFVYEQSSDIESDDGSSRNPVLDYVDVYHELVDKNDNSDVFRFRIFAKYNGIVKWARDMGKYGLDGNIADLAGLKEEVEIAFGNGDFSYIKNRKLVALPDTDDMDDEDFLDDDDLDDDE